MKKDIQNSAILPKISEKIFSKDDIASLDEKYISGNVVYQGDFITVQRDHVALPDGNIASREYFLHPGAVAIVPLFSDKKVLVEKQFRHPTRQIYIEYPAGKLDQIDNVNEYESEKAAILKDCVLSRGKLSSTLSALRCAQRELREETGLIAENWQFITRIHPAIAYSNEFIDIFLAEELHQFKPNPDPGEFIVLEKVLITQMLDWIEEGIITDPKTIIATLWLEKKVL